MRRGDDWNDDTGGGPGTAADDLNRNLPAEQVTDSNRYNFKIGIYGWRKRCLYLLILGLMVMVIVNLALTLWVLKVMEFSSDGMGQLRVVTGGLQLSGQALVLDALRASTIRSRLGQSMTFESSKNFTVNTRDNEGFLENRLFLSNDRLECLTQGFLVTDARGSVLFSSNKKETVVGSETLRVTGEGGTSFSGSIQTPLVRSDARHDLRLESPTRGLEIRAPLAITIESRAGDLTATCLNDLKLHSVAGSIRLEGPNIMMPGLKTASPAPPQSAQSRGTRAHDIYQLCACANGKLFLAPPHGACAVDESGHMCR